MDAFATKRLESIFGKKVPPIDLMELVDVAITVRRDEGIGLELKCFFVISMTLTGPCVDIVKVGDVLLHINGVPVVAMDKVSKQIQDSLKFQPSGKVILKLLRMKRQIPRPVVFPVLPKRDGYVYDTLVLYLLKGIFHFGLDVKEIEGKLVVCDTLENSLSDITFSLGEMIIDVDGEKTTTCAAFNDRVKRSMDIRNFCLVTVETPATDPLKNMLRNKISNALKDNRINRIPPDAKYYANEGIAVFKKHGNDPLKSIWMTPDKIQKEIMRSATDLTTHFRMDDKVKETDVPSEWNSRLFVKLPPMKTLESESPQQ
uniref:PDZ domain-containing protein n=2 Tax=Caenorhabditis japonica TaxID=281687 RepID=A0A8R1HU63_CAEJA